VAPQVPVQKTRKTETQPRYAFLDLAKITENPMKLCAPHPVFSLFFSSIALVGAAPVSQASPNAPPVLILATTEEATLGVQVINGTLDAKRPGHYVELTRKVSEQCGVLVEFKFMPWARALQAVESGIVSAAFASSYKPERAVYGAYPMKDGQPDESRAQRNLAYHLYADPETAASFKMGESATSGAHVAVERDASIIPLLESQGMVPRPLPRYESILSMVAMKRAMFGAGIADNLDPILSQNPDLAAKVVKIEPPLQKQIGYVMFGKAFYEKHRDAVECFWDQSAVLSKSHWYEMLKKQYESQ
jgi:polar amino acid transport system substrate-binding protein